MKIFCTRLILVVFLILISFGLSKKVFASGVLATIPTATTVSVGGSGFTSGVSYQITLYDHLTSSNINHTFATATGNNGSFGVTFSNLTPSHSYDIMATLQSNGTPASGITNFSTIAAPTVVTLTATPSTLITGQSTVTTLAWSATNVTGSCIAASNPNIIAVWDNAHKALSGTQQVTVVASNNFTLTCTNSSGNVVGQAQAHITVSAGGGSVSAPTANPLPGTFTGTQNVTLSSATSGATFRYVLDSSTPNCSMGLTTNPVNIQSTTTIRAIACDSHGVASPVSSLTYTINTSGGGNPPPPPSGGPTTSGLLVANDPTSAMVTLTISGIPNNYSTFDLSVYNEPGTNSYYQTHSISQDGFGGAEDYFNGLAPSGSYKAYVSDSSGTNLVTPVTFSTLATDPIVVGGNGSNTSGGNVTSATSLSSPAGGLVPECTSTKGCQWKELLSLVNKVVKFILFALGIPIAAIMFMYAGFKLITSGGNPSELTKAKGVFGSVFMGIVLAAAAWLIINVVLTTLGYDGSWIGF
ncbi:MAG: chitobiase/beta-hexosaminidase C-terminal domain-containing protein [Candidatus Nomurabacteria bacterium]|nr:chitobiase/beta-hexosaminidase C-terminal domain-containing protein [Candidatus Nomurabacteria bacterium]